MKGNPIAPNQTISERVINGINKEFLLLCAIFEIFFFDGYRKVKMEPVPADHCEPYRKRNRQDGPAANALVACGTGLR
jgi:hypothetical protein